MKKRAGLVIYRKSGDGTEYLMLKSSKDENDWSPPKGHLDDGEDEYTAALRETREEVGYALDDLMIYRNENVIVDQKMQTGQTKTVTLFLAQLTNTDKIPTLSPEHTEYRWVDREQATSMFQISGDSAGIFGKFNDKIFSQ